MRRLFYIFCILTTLIWASACRTESTLPEKTSENDFSALCDEIFAHLVSTDSLTKNYTLSNPDAYDVKNTPKGLGRYTEESFLSEYSYYENVLHRLDAIDPRDLPNKDAFTYSIIDKTFRQYDDYQKYIFYEEPLSPVSGICTRLPVLLSEYHFYGDEDVQSYFDIIESVPSYFSDIISFEQKKKELGLFMSAEMCNEVITACTDFINGKNNNYLPETFSEKIASVPGITAETAATYSAKNEQYINDYLIPSYEKMISALNELGEDASPSYGLLALPEGKDYYSRLLYQSTCSDKSPKQCYELLEKTLSGCRSSILKAVIKDPDLSDKLDSLVTPFSSPEDIMQHLTNCITPTFPVTDKSLCSYTIKYVHPSLEKSLSPAMYITPPIDTISTDSIYINKAYTDDDSMFTTLAHEGYPGHMYQTRYFMSTNPHPLRLMLNFAGYCEGWATYAEIYSYNYCGYDKNATSVLQNEKLSLLCLYALADIGVHYYGWELEDTISLLSDNGIDDVDAAKNVHLAVSAEPALYPKYVVSCIELLNMYKYAESKLGGNFDERDFHNFILSTGPAWFSLIEKELRTWINIEKSHYQKN